MPVYDRSYRRWDGKLKRRALRFVPIVSMGVRNALGMKGGWLFTLLLRLFMLASVVPTLLLFFANFAYVAQPDFLKNSGFLAFLEQVRPYRTLQYPLLTRMNMLFLAVYVVLFGSGLIARDRASGALPLYLSRPVTLADYVLGKAGILAWFIASFTLIPNLVLWLFDVLSGEADGALRAALPNLAPIFLQNLTLIAVYSFTMLAVSAMCRRPMFAALIWFTLVVALPAFTAGFGSQLGSDALPALAPNDAIHVLGWDLFGLEELAERARSEISHPGGDLAIDGLFSFVTTYTRTPPALAWLSVSGWTLAAVALLVRMLRRQDVMGEAVTR